MATRAPSADARRAPPTLRHFAALPPGVITRVLSRYDREQLEGFIAVAIDLLDFADGDPEAETTGLEDDFIDHWADGPGCPISDVDRCCAYDDDPAKLFGDDKPGDPDDREDDDPAGDSLDETGEAPTDTGTPMLPRRPIYGDDQSRGPLNEKAAYIEWHKALS